MCGITGGIWTNPQRVIEERVLERMTNILRHRGPDDQGRYVSQYKHQPPYDAMPGVALGHRRLSIIDIEGGHQPLSNEDRSVWVVFNGEIYNYESLRNRLEGTGHSFRTRSDTEVIVHLYEDEHTNCFAHLNGMFAIGIWDANRRSLVLARDRLGQKPLVYRVEPDRLTFASELKSLLEVPGVRRDIDPGAVDEYLTYGYVPHPNTIFRGIRKLPPAHYAVFQDGRFQIGSYWDPKFETEGQGNLSEYMEKLRELLRSSVELRMRSDVPLGAFLSGGMDSSIVVALMQSIRNSSIRTFSIGFPVPEYNETVYATEVAQQLGTEHHEYQVVPDCVAILPKLIWNFDEPFADSSAIPTWYLSQWTRDSVTVALTGDGGDELFAGYPRYRAVQLGAWIDSLPWPVRSSLAHRLWTRLPASPRQKSLRRRFKRFTSAIGLPPMQRYLEWIATFHEAQRASLYTTDFLGELPESDPADFLRPAWNRCKGRDLVSAASLTDMVTYLPCDLMTKVDLASMAHSLECRQPFLDYRLVELAIEMPIQMKTRYYRGKRILWEAFGHHLPPSIGRRRKMGFGVPLDHWFRNELREMVPDLLLDATARSRRMFQSEEITRLVQDHVTGTFDHSQRLWALLVFELWMREWGS